MVLTEYLRHFHFLINNESYFRPVQRTVRKLQKVSRRPKLALEGALQTEPVPLRPIPKPLHPQDLGERLLRLLQRRIPLWIHTVTGQSEDRQFSGCKPRNPSTSDFPRKQFSTCLTCSSMNWRLIGTMISSPISAPFLTRTSPFSSGTSSLAPKSRKRSSRRPRQS